MVQKLKNSISLSPPSTYELTVLQIGGNTIIFEQFVKVSLVQPITFMLY